MPGLISDNGMMGVSSAARARAGHSRAKMMAQKPGMGALNFTGSENLLLYFRLNPQSSRNMAECMGILIGPGHKARIKIIISRRPVVLACVFLVDRTDDFR